jgi:hypothetical protein
MNSLTDFPQKKFAFPPLWLADDIHVVLAKWLIFYDAAKKWSKNFAGKNKTLTFAVLVPPSLSTMLKSGGRFIFICECQHYTRTIPNTGAINSALGK